MNILIACEESQRVCIEFRKLGHNCFSCDIEPESGGHPEWHIQDDVLKILNWKDHGNNCGGICFTTMNGEFHDIPKWDLIIAHPPCTYLTNTGNRWFNIEKYGEKAIKRLADREEAIRFFMKFVNADCDHIAIENPIGCMSTRYRKPEQIIQPYEYGDPERKSTCLWLKNLPKLVPTNIVEPKLITLPNGKTMSKYHYETWKLSSKERAKVRSKTFPGIAKAIALQWSAYLEKELKEKD